MPPAAKRRPRRPAQDSLRPGWMLNCILFSSLLAGIGACYVWLGVKEMGRKEQIRLIAREIEDIHLLMKANEGHLSRLLAPESLRAKTETAGLELKPIDVGSKGRLIHLPEPVVPGADAPALPAAATGWTPAVFAENRQP